ncbi:uncharacterized protein SAPINGB_P002767 [Magnusiomyces paraingens]|uniref:Post-GPI attachment to proteins factor 3 n=1 Tax=Magnusiomyces paraingens TaxID=2606893 RepID=A0A5E8BHD7_9ASCO|nr:uncharacterized protein SAPINGB_P002767 [Saprochaete ingens]VVT50449.1 unnamed protein product [Saprochaete ingens]
MALSAIQPPPASGPGTAAPQRSYRRLIISVLFVLVAFSLLPGVSASTGDRLPDFISCTAQCDALNCDEGSSYVPIYLRLLFWTCSQNCDYTCQRLVTADRIMMGESVEQFHGKWPFLRIAGVQEPLSVLFSILNFVPHYHGFRALLSSLRAPNAPTTLLWVYLGIAITGMNAWTWSSVFHTRDFVVTECLDYFSAGLTVLYGFYAASVRVFRLDYPRRRYTRYTLAFVCIVLYILHVLYLSLVRFNYGYNMLANVFVGLLQNVLWVSFSLFQYWKFREYWRLWPLGLVITVSLAMSFELFDFPPILDMLDAHALWHAGTVLPTYWWYNWMNRDIQALKTSKVKN